MMASRRDFLSMAGLALSGAMLTALGLNLKDQTPARLRPPGARPDDEFLAACIRCGQCVEACPYRALKLSDTDSLVAVGTPFIEPRHVPCYLCQGHADLLCIAACPSGALRPVESLTEIRMGTAIIDQSTCLAWQGTSCRACWHACPLPDDALRLEVEYGRPEVTEHCIGCGLCVHACLTEPASVDIQPA